MRKSRVGNSVLGTVSAALPPQMLDALNRLWQVKSSALESKKRMVVMPAEAAQFIVVLKSVNRSQAHFLSPEEIVDLRATKQAVAQRTFEILRQA